MDAARGTTGLRTVGQFLAGLQAGMSACLWMLAWLGLSTMWQRRSFWTAENLMATAFAATRAIRTGFGCSTISGLALYLLIYSLLGALFGVGDARPHAAGACVVVERGVWPGLVLPLVSRLWKSLIPLLARLHAERATVLGHLIYGTVLARYPVYLERWEQPAGAAETAPAHPVEAADKHAEQLDA